MTKSRSKIAKQKNLLQFTVYAETGLLPFLLKVLSGRSRNSVKSILTRGQVTVDDHVETKHDYPLKPGQTVFVFKEQSSS